jgi:hypothetical protein
MDYSPTKNMEERIIPRIASVFYVSVVVRSPSLTRVILIVLNSRMIEPKVFIVYRYWNSCDRRCTSRAPR